MRRYASLLAAALCVVGTSALAADAYPPQRQLPQPRYSYDLPPASNWSQWSVGVYGSYAFDGNTVASDTYGSTTTMNKYPLSGWGAGGSIGRDWQIGSVVLGLETKYGWSGVGHHREYTWCTPDTCGFSGKDSIRTRLNHAGSTTIRAGYLLNPTWLVYVGGGAAYGQVETTTTTSMPDVTSSFSDARMALGWTVRGGTEYKFAENWSAFAEYVYSDYGVQKTRWSSSWSPTGGSSSSSFNIGEVQAGVKFRF